MARNVGASPTPRTRSAFASKTAFEALAVESGEESEEEQEEVVEPTPSQDLEASAAQESQPQDVAPEEQTPPKLSRSALKKAARAARKQAQEVKPQQHESPQSSPSKSGSSKGHQHREPSPAPPGTAANPVHITPEPDYEVVELNGDTHAHNDGALSDAEPTAQSIFAPNGHAAAANADVPQSGTTPKSRETAPLSPTRSSRPSAVLNPLSDATSKATSQTISAASSAKNMASDAAHAIAQQAPGTFPVDQKSKDSESTKKRQNVLVRTLMTLVMISGFLICLALGHGFMIVLVMVCQTLVYREVTALFALGAPKSDDSAEVKGKDPWSKTLNWYFFAVTNYFLYGESLIYYFKHVVFVDSQLLPFATNHRFISFMLYMFGFVGFVASLQKQYLKSQFGLFCWVHMSLLVVVVSSHFIINNILEGLIWFWVPASLVICNDVFAYIFGITMGRTPLIKLSPKKTVEGFVGGAFSTVLFALVWGTIFMRFDYMICPARNLGVNALSPSISCVPNPVFVWREWSVPAAVRVGVKTLVGVAPKTIPYAPYHFHLLVMATFASLVAPFGGFFASGFKRAFNIKDFGHSIPGHGGMTDRMDCQFLMGVFTYVYYSSLVKEHNVTVGSVLQTIVSGLTLEEQLELLVDFRRYLEGRGVDLGVL